LKTTVQHLYNEAGGHSMNKFLVLFEESATGYGAYAPDLPGCVATGRTLEETRGRMARAMEMHLSAMREDGDAIREPSLFEVLEAV
jgi:predicted RNase H-like HicB family nuclease